MLAALFPAILPIISGLIDRLVPDTEAAAKAKSEASAQLMAALAEADNRQIEVNKVEAASGRLFVAGWRPFIGWVAGAALAYHYLLRPLLPWLVALFGLRVAPLPGLDDTLYQLVLAMLGLGGLRSFEKIQGVARK